jgi:hypothetical protein
VFAVFLFLTYYLQQGRGYTPIRTGVALRPLSGAVMLSAIIATTKLRMRFGPRADGRRDAARRRRDALPDPADRGRKRPPASCAHQARHPTLIRLGVGLGLVFSTSINSATLGVQPADAGVASGSVSAAQQIGGSLDTALLSTIAASAVTTYIATAHAHPTRLLLANAAVRGDTRGFAWAAAIFAAGAVIAAALFERGTKALRIAADAALATAH